MDNRLKLEACRDDLDRALRDVTRTISLDAMDKMAKAYFSCATQAVSIAIGHIDKTLNHGVDEPIEGAVTVTVRLDGPGLGALVDGRTGEVVA